MGRAPENNGYTTNIGSQQGFSYAMVLAAVVILVFTVGGGSGGGGVGY